MSDLKIGALAKRAATNGPTIRYYEEIGLLPHADRQAGGQRIYGEEDVRRLVFIRRCRVASRGVLEFALARGLRRGEGSGSGCEVNGQIGRLYGEGFPAIDFAHADLPGGNQRPEHHSGGFG
jgi:hypothetical protein